MLIFVMTEHKTIIGKDILKMLMFSMYPDAKTIYREYIQNACDSINEAVNNGILTDREGHISVKINNIGRTIKIYDNGCGIKSDEVAPRLKDIANSDKDGITTIGVYGIGRLVGAGYCKKLIFRTSYPGEPIASEITFDVVRAYAIINDKDDKRSASEVIDTIASIETTVEEADKHYFEVSLLDVKQEYPELLNDNNIGEYLKQVAPIDYTMPFKSTLIKSSLKETYINLHASIKHYRISINNITDIRKPYDLIIDGTDDVIDSLEYFKIEDSEHGLLAWGWYGITAFTKAIPPSGKNRGIRLRKHNVLVGDADILNQYFSESRGNNYFVGELHAIHDNLHPEGSRSGLAPTIEAERLKIHLRNHFDYLKKLYHLANDAKKATERLADATVAHEASVNPTETHLKVQEAQSNLDKIEKSRNAQDAVGKKIIEIAKKKIVTSVSQNRQPAPTANNKGLSAQQNSLSLDNIESVSDDGKKLLKRVFAIMENNCPNPKDKKLLEELKRLVIKELAK